MSPLYFSSIQRFSIEILPKLTHHIFSVSNQGRIQDLWLGGAWVGEGSGDRSRSPAGPRQSPGRGSRGAMPPPPRKLWGFEELQTFIRTTNKILNQPHHFYQTKKTWLWVLITFVCRIIVNSMFLSGYKNLK